MRISFFRTAPSVGTNHPFPAAQASVERKGRDGRGPNPGMSSNANLAIAIRVSSKNCRRQIFSAAIDELGTVLLPAQAGQMQEIRSAAVIHHRRLTSPSLKRRGPSVIVVLQNGRYRQLRLKIQPEKHHGSAAHEARNRSGSAGQLGMHRGRGRGRVEIGSQHGRQSQEPRDEKARHRQGGAGSPGSPSSTATLRSTIGSQPRKMRRANADSTAGIDRERASQRVAADHGFRSRFVGAVIRHVDLPRAVDPIDDACASGRHG